MIGRGRSFRCRTRMVELEAAGNFIWFLSRLDQAIDPALEIHIIMDNGSSHTSKMTSAPRARPSSTRPQSRA